jgi:hypothetical protein
MKLNFVASEEERYAYNEAAHEARMSMSEWIRQVLNDAAGGHHVATPISRSVPDYKLKESTHVIKDVSSIESLKGAGLLISGKDVALPSRTIPKWAEEDTEDIAYNRELLFGKNPLRMMSQREADFNKLSKIRGQKYNEDGTPRLDLKGEYIPVD